MLKFSKLLFLLLLFISFNVSARINDLEVFCNDGEPFTLIMNGERYNDVPQVKVTVTGLELQQYKVTIIFNNKNIKVLNTTLTFYNTGNVCVFSLNKHGKRKYTMDYLSSKKINPEEKTEPVQTTTDNSNSNTNTNTNSTPYTPPPAPKPTNSVSMNTAYGNVGVNENGGINIGGKNGNVDLNTKNPSGKVGINVGGQTINLNKAERSNCSSPMNALKFDEIKKKVESYTTEEEKLKAAEMSLDGNCFTTSQVKTLLLMLKEDSSKMELAKKAYSNTNDLNNYKSLKDVFGKQVNEDEFVKFVHSMK